MLWVGSGEVVTGFIHEAFAALSSLSLEMKMPSTPLIQGGYLSHRGRGFHWGQRRGRGSLLHLLLLKYL